MLFGEYAEEDLGRCMVGDITDEARGLQVWVNDVYDCKGNRLDIPAPSTNMRIQWAGDLTAQLTDTPDTLREAYREQRIVDPRRGVLLEPEDTRTNNGTKGNPCLVADLFGDWREELLLRRSDSSAIRIYTNPDDAPHKLFTLMHDPQYRCGVAWQNTCYNQPVYPSFYYASDMRFSDVLRAQTARPTLYPACNAAMLRFASERGLPCLDLGAAMVPEAALYQPDGVHLNKQGARRAAAAFVRLLRECGDKRLELLRRIFP